LTLSKQWLDDEIAKWVIKKDEQTTQYEMYRITGIIQGLKLAFVELTKSPQKATKPKKEIDVDKAYESIIRFYIDKKGYTKEQANKIAMKCVKDQKQERLES